MKISNFSFKDKNFLLVLLYCFLFYLFVIPYSAVINGGGVSVNYFFALFPIIAFFIKKEIMFPPKSVIAFMAMLCIIFIYGSISQEDFYDLFFRRSASFIIFMTIFAFMFVKIDQNMINAFKFAIILWGLYDSSLTISEYISIDGNSIGAHAKGILGSQRVGIIYLMGFWSVITFNIQNNYLRIFKFILAFILLSGLFLTYSRSSMLGLATSTLIYFIFIVFNASSTNSIRYAITKLAASGVYFLMLFAFVFLFFNGSVQFYTNTIFNYLFKTKIEFIDKDQQESILTTFDIYENIKTELNEVSLQEKQNDNLISVIENLRPNTKWDLIDNKIIWNDTEQSKPSIEEVVAEMNLLIGSTDLPNPKELARIYIDTIVDDNLIRTSTKEEQPSFIKNIIKEFYNNTNEIDQITKRLYQNQQQYELLININAKDQNRVSGLNKQLNESNNDQQKILIQSQLDALKTKEERSYRNLREHMKTVTRYEYEVQLKILRLLSIQLDKLLQDSNFNSQTNEIEVSIANKIKVDLKKSIVDIESKTMELTPFQKRLSNKGTSIGYRAFMHNKVYEETLKKPLTGSAFLGVWSMFESKKGSAHSQYLDVLFRVGILGFIIYMIFLIKVALALLKIDIGLFLGLIAMIFVGLVHETFKLSQGAFMYSFFFGIWAQRAILSKNDRKFS